MRRAFAATLPLYIASRLLVLCVAKASTWLFPQLTVTNALASWDGGWYLTIAADGYPNSFAIETDGGGVRWAFFPGLPGLIRIISEVTGLSLAVSGILLSTIAGAAAVAMIWWLVSDTLDEETATTTCAVLCFFPSAFVLSMVYTESIFLLVTAVGLFAVTRRKWVLAGVMASVASLIRAPGLTMVMVVVVVAVAEVVRRRRVTARMVLGVALSFLGFGAWSLYQSARVDDPFAFLEALRVGWYQEFNWLSTPFRSLWRLVSDRSYWSAADEVMGALTAIAMAISWVAAWRFARRNRGVIPLEWWLLSLGATLFAFSPYWPGSTLRYALAAFPIFAVALARLPRRFVLPLVCSLAGLMAAFAIVAFGGIVNWQDAPFAP